VEAFSRYVVASPIRDKSALSIAKVLVHDVITKFGCFQSLQTDNGKEFQNEVLQHMCQLLHIDQLRITSYRPSGNGRCEIINKTLHSLLGKVVANDQRDWCKRLPMCVLAYNTSRHESTGMSPYYLMYSRSAILPLDLLLDTPEDHRNSDYHEYADEVTERMREAYKLVQEHQDVQIERMKRNYNVGVKPQTFKVNDLVYYYYPRKYVGRTPKWTRVYDGGYRVEKVINDVVYVIRKTPTSKPVVANVDKLKLHYGKAPEFWRKAMDKIAKSAERPAKDRPKKTGLPADGGATDRVAESASENKGQFSGPQHSHPAESASENVGQFSGPQRRQPAQHVSESGARSLLRPTSTRVKRLPRRYCQRVMERKRRVSAEHFCQVCTFRYRSQGSCYKHMAKKHGMYYLPGRAPQPIPPDELERLLRVFAQADLNSRQRRKAAADTSSRRTPRVESRSPPRRRRRSPSSE